MFVMRKLLVLLSLMCFTTVSWAQPDQATTMAAELVEKLNVLGPNDSSIWIQAQRVVTSLRYEADDQDNLQLKEQSTKRLRRFEKLISEGKTAWPKSIVPEARKKYAGSGLKARIRRMDHYLSWSFGVERE